MSLPQPGIPAIAASPATVAGAIAAASPDAPHPHCANCAQSLLGDFCHQCGQSAHLHRSVAHLGEEVLHGLYHFDAKGWRTFPLLVARPGQLTRRYIDGQRVRFVSPLGLFLFMIFVMFLVFSLAGDGSTALTRVQDVAQRSELKSNFEKNLAESRAAVAAAQRRLDEARRSGGAVADAESALNDALREERIAAKILQPFATPVDTHANAASDNTKWGEQLVIDTGSPTIDRSLRHALDNPELAWYKLKSTAYKFAILLVPISLPFLWLLFARRRDIGMYDHAVFALYSMSFMSLMVILATILAAAGYGNLASTGLILIAPVHMFAQLRGTYNLGIGAALWRAGLLSIAAATVFTLFLLLILVLTVR